jgi:hypothetical protein
MKRCIRAHHVAAFGDIPVGSLWDDESPYLEDASAFVDASAPLDDEPLRPVKKSVAKVKES